MEFFEDGKVVVMDDGMTLSVSYEFDENEVTMLCAIADRFTGRIKDGLVIFGRVPFAFYVAHVALIHTLSVLLGIAQGFQPGEMMTIFFFYPSGYGVPLPAVYVVWAVVIAMLYPFCRWVASLKARRRDWWLSYV